MQKSSSHADDQPYLQWAEKGKILQFGISSQFEIENKSWVSDSSESIQIKQLLRQEIKDTFIIGPIHRTLRTVREFYTNSKTKSIGHIKPRLAIYAPPLQVQDEYFHQFTPSEFLSLTFDHFRLIREILDDTGFVLVQYYGNRYAQTKILLDEVFGRENFISTVIWKKAINMDLISNKYPHLLNAYYQNPFDYFTIYAKDIRVAKIFKFPPMLKGFFNPDNDPRGPWESRPLIASEKSSNPEYTYKFKNGYILTRKFRYAPSTIKKIEAENRIHYTNPKNRPGIPRVKIFYRDRLTEFNNTGTKGRTSNSLWADPTDFGTIMDAITESDGLYPMMNFYPMQSRILYEKLILLLTQTGDLLIDCFAEAGISILNALTLKRSWIGLGSQMVLIQKHLIPWLEKNIALKITSGIHQIE